jgi:segregation and condensation protein B
MGKDNKDNKELINIIESILFVAEKPVSIAEISKISGTVTFEVQKALLALTEDYKKRGLRIIRKGNYFQLITAPEVGEYIARYLNQELKKELGQAALEALAIITYKQPITRLEVEKIRGVNCDAILRTLQIKGLIQEVDRKDAPGRPILYGTTFEFLQYLGVESLEELPSLSEEDKDNIKPTFKF